MNRRGVVRLSVFATTLWAFWIAAGLWPGALHVTQHEGDTLHFADIVLRMAAGQMPHLDFMTPIGLFAFLPIALFVWLGLPLGTAYVAGQGLVGALLAVAALRIAASRLAGFWAYSFLFLVLGLALAYVHGAAEPVLSVSMHYNRWGWAIGICGMSLALISPQRRRPILDGICLGVLLAALAMIKLTYFIALAPAITCALVVRRAGFELLMATISGLAVALAVTLVAGFGFWGAYLGDLLTVLRTETRPFPSASLFDVVTAPAFLGATGVGIAATLLIARLNEAGRAVSLGLFIAGAIYVTFQNFGNDPIWLLALPFFILPLVAAKGHPRVWTMAPASAGLLVAGASVLLSLPSAINLAVSPLRHALVETRTQGPLITGPSDHRLNARIGISYAPNRMEPMSDGFVILDDRLALKTPLSAFESDWPYCEVQVGLSAFFETIAADLALAAPGARVFTADLFSAFWMFDDLDPTPGQAPWYYGGLSGLDEASHVLIPICATAPDLRNRILSDLQAASVDLEKVHQHTFYTLYEIKR